MKNDGLSFEGFIEEVGKFFKTEKVFETEYAYDARYEDFIILFMKQIQHEPWTLRCATINITIMGGSLSEVMRFVEDHVNEKLEKYKKVKNLLN